jgi:multicomponent Na+:H+ antiporter subunit D
VLIIISGLTMVTGVLGAAAQFEIRKILSFHIISQIGYMTLGLALFTPLALAAAIFYLVHHIIVKTNLFLIGGVIRHIKGSYDLKKIGGLYLSNPLLAFLFLVPALSLGGIPPLSGFFAKFTIIRAGLEVESYLIVLIALAVGILTLYSMTKIWAEAFWKVDPAEKPVTKSIPIMMLLPIILMAAATIAIGFFPEPVLEISRRAADQLFNPEYYIRKVLGVY